VLEPERTSTSAPSAASRSRRSTAAWFIEALHACQPPPAGPRSRAATVDNRRRLARGRRRSAGHGDRRARHQARLARPGVLPPGGAWARGGRRFTIIKFPLDAPRDAEASGTGTVGPSEGATRASHPAWARSSAASASTSFPQLWNVPSPVEMALVGPSPGAPRGWSPRSRGSCPSTEPRHPRPPRASTGVGPGLPRRTQRPSRRRSRNCPTTSITSSTSRSPTDAGIMLSTLGVHGRRTWSPLAAENREKGRVFMRTIPFQSFPLVRASPLCVMPAVALASNGGTTAGDHQGRCQGRQGRWSLHERPAQVRAQEPAAQAVRRSGRQSSRSITKG